MSAWNLSPDLMEQYRGTEFVCCSLAWFFQGAIFCAAYAYATDAFTKKDSRSFKAFVGALFLLSFIDILLTMVAAYQEFVIERESLYWTNPHIKFILPVFSAIIGSMVHTYFIRRCYIVMNKPKWLLAVFCLPWAFPLVASARVAHLIWTKYDNSIGDPLFGTWLACWTFVDLGITSILLYRLFKYKQESSFAHTTTLLNLLIVLSFSTCLIVSACQIVSLALFYSLDTQTGCASLRSVERIQILCLLAHVITRKDRRDASIQSKPDFISFGSSTGCSYPPIYIGPEKRDIEDGQEAP